MRNEMEHGDQRHAVGCSGRLLAFLQSAHCKLYCSYALSTWGDRMWTFACSLALVNIGCNLRLPAASGLTNDLAVLLFASAVGRWIDRTGRLKSNCVALAASTLACLLHWSDDIAVVWDGALRIIFIVLAIVLTAGTMLAGAGTKIFMAKDWVVVLAGDDKAQLADLNAMLLRIDLTANILAPLVAGQLMASWSMALGCAFIGAWNVASYVLEYYFLVAIYRSLPALAAKKFVIDSKAEHLAASPLMHDGENEKPPLAIISDASSKHPLPNDESSRANQSNLSKANSPAWLMPLRLMLNAWKLYRAQYVFPAALGLALLYMTVLGIDGITRGFAYSQGLQENVLAGATGTGAIIGILGSFAYPRLRKRIGLSRSGLFGLACQLSALALSLVSIVLPGSPFDPISASSGNQSTTISNVTQCDDQQEYTGGPADMSIWFFIAGVVLARFGLWLADLSISQIMQEHVAEHERGVVNGTQQSLNQAFDMLKNILVIGLPYSGTFGILIILSYCAVFSGFCSFAVYAKRDTGHIFSLKCRSYDAARTTDPTDLESAEEETVLRL